MLPTIKKWFLKHATQEELQSILQRCQLIVKKLLNLELMRLMYFLCGIGLEVDFHYGSAVGTNHCFGVGYDNFDALITRCE